MVSACALGYSYYAVTEGINEVLSTNKRMLAIIAIGSISTFFISWSLSGLILKIVKSNKKFYYKGLNSFTLNRDKKLFKKEFGLPPGQYRKKIREER